MLLSLSLSLSLSLYVSLIYRNDSYLFKFHWLDRKAIKNLLNVAKVVTFFHKLEIFSMK